MNTPDFAPIALSIQTSFDSVLREIGRAALLILQCNTDSMRGDQVTDLFRSHMIFPADMDPVLPALIAHSLSNSPFIHTRVDIYGQITYRSLQHCSHRQCIMRRCHEL